MSRGPEITPFPRPDWSPLPHEGCVGVDGKVLVREHDLLIAMLRFREHATVHEHPGDVDTTVLCIEGEGFTSVGDAVSRIRESERVEWPRGIPHRLWTEDSTMTTLMVERDVPSRS